MLTTTRPISIIEEWCSYSAFDLRRYCRLFNVNMCLSADSHGCHIWMNDALVFERARDQGVVALYRCPAAGPNHPEQTIFYTR